MKSLYVWMLMMLWLAGCASGDKSVAPNEVPDDAIAVEVLEAPQGPGEMDLNDDETDMQKLPAVLNEKVTQWIDYFQGRGRPHMKRYLSRSSRYLPKMKAILKSHGLPEDLVYIALIESGFNSKALSSASAVGYWQFIRGTGRRYGLQQNYYIDERRDFIEATEGAAMYLKALYNLFGSWYLAIASYNVGENRIKNLVMRYYTRDFWKLAADNRLPRETTNYVPKFLAARLIAKHPEKYGFDDVVYEPPLDFKEITVKNKGVNLKQMAKHLGVSKKVLYGLNPSYKRGIIPKRKSEATLRVPSAADDKQVVAALAKSSSNVTMAVIASGEGETYRIRRGDTLSHIAQRFGTSIRAIHEANNLNRRSTLYPGKKLLVPTGQTFSTAKKVAKISGGEKRYKVRRGDNLYTISKKYGVSLSRLKKRNKLGRRSLLKIGQSLVIPGQTTSKRAVSSIKDRVIHIVRRGDTLYAIAKRYGTTISALTRVNKMSRRSRLSIGKKLVIP